METYELDSPAIYRSSRFIVHEYPWSIEDTSYQDCHGFMMMGKRIHVKRIRVPNPDTHIAILFTNQGVIWASDKSCLICDGFYSITEVDPELVDELGWVPQSIRFIERTQYEISI